jgi:hypothetical protein
MVDAGPKSQWSLLRRSAFGIGSVPPAASPGGSPRLKLGARLRKPMAVFLTVVSASAGAAALGVSAFSASAASGQTTAPAATVALPPAAPTPTPPATPAVRVAVVGDSLIATTTPQQQAELAGRGYDVTVQGNPGKPLTDPWIQDRLGETDGADIVVVATASNDNVSLAKRADEVGLDQARAEYAQTLRAALERVDAPCSVVVDVRTESSALYRPETAAMTNTTLRSVAGTRTTVVVPWSTVSAGHDHNDWFVADELHFINGDLRQDAGVQAYADAIADGVDQCAELIDR